MGTVFLLLMEQVHHGRIETSCVCAGVSVVLLRSSLRGRRGKDDGGELYEPWLGSPPPPTAATRLPGWTSRKDLVVGIRVVLAVRVVNIQSRGGQRLMLAGDVFDDGEWEEKKCKASSILFTAVSQLALLPRR
jgi:hypothetical protein